MVYVFTVLALIFLAFLIIGIFKPKAVIRWGSPEKASRKKVLLVYGLGCLVLLFLIGITAPEPTEEEKAIAQQKQIQKEIEKQNKAQEKQQEKENQKKENQEKKEEEKEDRDVEAQEVQIISTDFATFEKEYDALTDLQKDELWKEIKGEYVQWTARVQDVEKNMIKLKIRDYHLGGYDFQAVIAKGQEDSLLNLQKDSTITVRGKLNTRKSTLFFWKITDAVIVQ